MIRRSQAKQIEQRSNVLGEIIYGAVSGLIAGAIVLMIIFTFLAACGVFD